MVGKITENFPLIIIKDVRYSYDDGTEAIKGINLNVYGSEIIGIMGQNGAGKTTLIRTLNGLIRPSSGIIYINGENIEVKTIAQLSQKIGIIFQNPQHQLFENSVEDEIRFSLKNLNLSKNEIQNRVESVLKTFNLEKYRERSPLNLSGGETKKLGIASIICRDPEIIVFDEPTLGQDAKEIKFFIELLKKEKEAGKTIIIVTHNIEFAVEHIPRTILMANGSIIADGPTRKLLSNELLVGKSSLVLPQIRKFNAELHGIGIECPTGIDSKKKMIAYLRDYIKTINQIAG